MVRLVKSFFHHLRKDGICKTTGIVLKWAAVRKTSFWKDTQWRLGYRWNPFVVTVPPEIDLPGIRRQLEELDIAVHSIRANRNEYHNYVEAAHYPLDYYGGGQYKGCFFEEKTLQHFMSIKCLGINSSDVVIDVAALNSPFSDIVRQLYKCTAYKLDLTYPPGIHADRIGSDAIAVPLPDGSVSKLVLHCSFEHFENERDIIFLKEANRLLCRNGKLCILPIYFCQFDFSLTDPFVDRHGIQWKRGEKIVYTRSFHNRFARFYSPQSFKKRIVSNMGSLNLEMFYLENNEEIDKTTALKFIALFEKH